MSPQRHTAMEPVKEPHTVSLKVLRLSRPSMVVQHSLATPSTLPLRNDGTKTMPASLAYRCNSGTNPDPFLLTPILNLPPTFGSAYVGETFSCTLCANHDPDLPPPGSDDVAPVKKKFIRDVRIDAEMKVPSSAVQKLDLTVAGGEGEEGTDLEPEATLQKIVNFELKEEGNHVLAVTVSYYEATETSGRTRTFRKLYQFVCKGSLIVRTKIGAVSDAILIRRKESDVDEKAPPRVPGRRWIMEAQLENCSEDTMQLECVKLQLEPGLGCRDANWTVTGSAKPVLHPSEVEQVCFVVEEDDVEGPKEEADGRVAFGVLGITWRTEMGNRGFLSTGMLGTKATR